MMLNITTKENKEHSIELALVHPKTSEKGLASLKRWAEKKPNRELYIPSIDEVMLYRIGKCASGSPTVYIVSEFGKVVNADITYTLADDGDKVQMVIERKVVDTRRNVIKDRSYADLVLRPNKPLGLKLFGRKRNIEVIE